MIGDGRLRLVLSLALLHSLLFSVRSSSCATDLPPEIGQASALLQVSKQAKAVGSPHAPSGSEALAFKNLNPRVHTEEANKADEANAAAAVSADENAVAFTLDKEEKNDANEERAADVSAPEPGAKATMKKEEATNADKAHAADVSAPHNVVSGAKDKEKKNSADDANVASTPKKETNDAGVADASAPKNAANGTEDKDETHNADEADAAAVEKEDADEADATDASASEKGAISIKALQPTIAQLTSASEASNVSPIEVLWQRPDGEVRAVLLMLHGCNHQATDWWPPSTCCSECLGLPEEVRITRAALTRGILPMAISSMDQQSKCWEHSDLERVERAVKHVYEAEHVNSSVPLYAYGTSSGGGLLEDLTSTLTVGRDLLRCRIPTVMPIAGSAEFAMGASPTRGSAKGDKTWPAPPTLFVHMPRDSFTAGKVSATLKDLWNGHISAAEVLCKPMPIDSEFFSSGIDNVTIAQSEALAAALQDSNLLDSDLFLRTDPRSSLIWAEILWKTGVPEEIGDTLEPGRSALEQEMAVAWAAHETCASWAGQMLDFCEDPEAACRRYGWSCG